MNRGTKRFLILGLAFANCALLLINFGGRWGHPFMDTSLSVLAPWRVLQGWMPYRDFQYYYGPFAPYWNALWLACFGPTLRVLFGAGILSALLTAWLLYLHCRGFCNRKIATVSALLFLNLYAFSVNWTGTTNFALPYTFSSTYYVCAFLAFTLFLRRATAGAAPSRNFILALSCFLLAALNRPDFAVASSLVFFWFHWKKHRGLRWGFPAAILAVLLVYSYFAAQTGLAKFLHENILFPAHGFGKAGGQLSQFHLMGYWPSGPENFIAAMAFLFLTLSLALIPVRDKNGAKFCIFLATAAGALVFVRLPDFISVAIPPLTLGATLVYWRVWRDRPYERSFAICAVLLCVRSLFHSPTDSYAFYANLPGLVVVTRLLFHDVPQQLANPVQKQKYTAVLTMIVALTLVASFDRNRTAVINRDVTVYTPGGTLYLRRGPFEKAYAQAVNWALNQPSPLSLAVIPDGGMFCFLTRADCRLYHASLRTNAVLSYPPGVIVSRMAQIQPKKILLFHDYDPALNSKIPFSTQLPESQPLKEWILEHYPYFLTFGPQPNVQPDPDAGGIVVFSTEPTLH